MSLEIKNINKSYGLKKVVDNISFSILEPGVIGLLGTNGAGKTTTIRIMLNILNSDSGSVTWNKKNFNISKVNFGYLPEERGLYPKISIYKQLLYFADLKNLDKKKTEQEIEYWFERLKVSEYKNMLPSQLSKGNQQKIQLIIALLGDPELIILDEPFSGLDPINTALLKEVVFELVEKKKYIIFCSHQMEMVESFCSHVIIIDKGKTVLNGNLKEIKDSYKNNNILLEVNKDIKKDILNLGYNIVSINNYEYIIEINDVDKKTLLKELLKKDIEIIKYETIKPTLNEIFIESVKKGEL